MTLTVPPTPKMLVNHSWNWYAHQCLDWGRQCWDEAERLDAEKESHEDAHWYEVGQNNALRSQLDACYTALGTTFYMDPPDGGDPGLAVMVGRMKAHRDELITQVRELAEALEVAQDAMDERRSYVSGGEPSTCWQEMKYGKVWDEEDAKVASALSRLASAPQRT